MGRGAPSASAAAERAQFVDLVGREIGAIWRNVTRLGGQCVAALYLAGKPRSMDDLAEELGRSKSNVFANLRALETLGIVRRVRVPGSARDHFELAGDYPDVIVVAFVRKLTVNLGEISSELRDVAKRLEDLAEAGSEDAQAAARVARLAEVYGAAGGLLDALLPPPGGRSDLAGVLARITPDLVTRVAGLLAASKKR